MYFAYEGSDIITLSKLVIIASSSSVGTLGSASLYDETNLATIATVATDEAIDIHTTTTFTNVPTTQAVFTLRYRKTAGNGKVRIHSMMLY